MSRPSPGPDPRRAALALGAGALAALCSGLDLVPALDDGLQRWQPAPSQPAPVLVLGIDATAPWPWPNERLAALLERLQAAGVRGVGLDLPIGTGTSADALGDARLARALLDGHVVLGVALEPQPDGAPRARLPPVEFTDSARLGHLLLPRDRDGRIRRHLPQVLADDGIQWRSLPVALARTGAGNSLEGETDAGWRVAATGDPPPVHDPAELMDGRMEASRLRGQWVLLGLADPSRQARLPGPHGSAPLFPVQHQARALAALLRGDTPRPLPAAAQALLALLLAGAATSAGLSRHAPAWRMPVALLAGTAATLALSAWLLQRHHWFAPGATVGVLALGLAAWATLALHRQWRTRRRLPGLATRRQLQAAVQPAAGAGTPHALLLLEYSLPGAHGRKATDACARQIAELLRTRARRPDDIAAWLGGCRFALLLHGTSAAAAGAILEQIRGQAGERGLALQGDAHACDADGCDCLRRLGVHAQAAR
ncbi:MAG: CHASE2 domain-containing protein [Xanthomonadaceae bacterium]|nr:CHASE2 domain-containing protein [Xanthomonadaceae bacterium]MCA0198057.1 CHASE2 domain-containing protein [Pseudomonadota bacterium]